MVATVVLTKDPASNFEEVKKNKLVRKISELKFKIVAIEKRHNKNKIRVKCYNYKKCGHMSKNYKSKKKFESSFEFVSKSIHMLYCFNKKLHYNIFV